MFKKKWKLLAGIGAGLFTTHVAVKTFAEKIFHDLFVTDRSLGDRLAIDFLPTDELKERYEQEVETHISWFQASFKKELTIQSYDGLSLKGVWLCKDPAYPTIILCHGYNADRYVLLKQAYEFAKYHYNVLMIDQRGYGDSEGEYTTFGFKESLDVTQWIQHLRELNPEICIGLYGVSMGAETVMLALANQLPENVKFVIEEAGFVDFKTFLQHKLQDIPAKNVLIQYLDLALRKNFAFSMADISAKNALKNNHIPICFIHSDEDKLIPIEDAKILYHINPGKKYYYPIKGMPHAYACYAKDYFATLHEFIQSTLH